LLEPSIDGLGLALILAFFTVSLPLHELLRAEPACGGDTGSHYWPLVTLAREALPRLALRAWNPGNLCGEPHLVHYFPLPFMVMAALGLLAPLGEAFNIGTMLPVLLLPAAVYAALRGLGARFPAPLLAAAASLMTVYNESNSMWGGNVLSLLAGQFAHAYALVFLMLGVGAAGWEMRRGRPPLLSALLFAGVALSHGYVFLGLPFVFLALLFFSPASRFALRFRHLLLSGVLALLLSFWFLLPSIDNSRWTTAYAFTWVSADILSEAAPPIFYPALALAALGLLLMPLQRFSRVLGALARQSCFWLLPALGYLLYYFIFPKFGVVDIRAIPQIQLFVCILGGLAAAALLQLAGTTVALSLALPAVLALFGWGEPHVQAAPGWVSWNYRGWQTKDQYPHLAALSRELRGSMSDPRVIFEHSELNGRMCSTRVFEMLPYFAGRATLESVYMQANILAPMVFYLQSEVSKTPSCPYPQYPCAKYDLQASYQRLRLMGVQDLILVSDETRSQADASPLYRKRGDFDIWHLYTINEPVALAEVVQRAEMTNETDWKELFYKWFGAYDGTAPFLLHASTVPAGFTPAEPPAGCAAGVSVSFSDVVLRTNCPGSLHILKFAYHPSWRSDTGEPVMLISPGMMAIAPRGEQVTLRFGRSAAWRLASWISLAALLGMLFWAMQRALRRSDE